MPVQPGLSASGMSGVIGPVGSTDTLFQCQVIAWETRREGQLGRRFGRNTSGAVDYRWIAMVGNGTAFIKERLDGKPEPTTWVGQKKTLTLQATTDKTVAYTVMVYAVHAEDNVTAFNNFLTKVTMPIERLFGTTSLGASSIRGFQTLGRSYNQSRSF